MSLTPPSEAETNEKDMTRSKRRPPTWVRWVVLVLVVLFLGVVGIYETSSHGFGGPGDNVTLQVTSGESYTSVAAALASKGVMSNDLSWKVYNAIHGTPTVQPGFYTIAQNSTFGAVHSLLASGPNTEALVVPPGFTLSEIVTRLEGVTGPAFATSVNTVLKSGSIISPFEPAGSKDLEGLVAPGTYLLPPSVTPTSLVQEMVNRFVTRAKSAGLTPSSTKHSLNSYQLVTVASVVEKEGYLNRNMNRVATVIYNRLGANMPLQMDATVLYALGQDGGPVTHATQAVKSPYNTYLNRGLPPTPICTPSQAALEATMHPATGSWLYFTVVDKTGTEAFSNTFDEQLANEKIAAKNGL